MASEERFGFEWGKYSCIDPKYEAQFQNWVHPLAPSDFKDKNILDAGCGMGRNSYWCLKYGARGVTAFDFDQRSVGAAQKNLKQFQNANVLYKSIYDIDWTDEFDTAFSIGVIHHLNNPKKAVQNLIRSVKKGGIILLWVYSYEGNEWIIRYINPIRIHITSKLPVRLVHFLSYFCSIPLWVFVKIFRGPNAYLRQLSAFSFYHIHSIVFDQLIPEVANYWTKKEVINLLQEAGLEEVNIHQPPNKSGWTVVGKK